MTAGGNDNGLMSEINVTPFVDVMLVLLIIFMVTAPMMVQGVNVSLPEVTSEPLESPIEPLIISINGEHKLFINDYEVSLDFFSEKLRNILKTRKDREVYLRADKSIPYGTVVLVMSEIKEAGVEKLGMVTAPVDPNENTKNGKIKD
jgi:biopolymer transport protein TolR